MEDKLNSVLSRIHSEVKIRIADEAEREERRRRERIEEEKRQRERQAEAERQRLEELERKRLAELMSEAECWKRSTVVREYIEALRKRAAENSLSKECREVFDEWIAWACQAADRLDPLERRLFGHAEKEQ